MPVKRFFVDEDFYAVTQLTISGKELHHIKDVINIRVGDEITSINGRGALAYLKVTGINKSHCICDIEKIEMHSKCYGINVAVANLHKHSIELLAEKLVEIGVVSLHIFQADKSHLPLPSNNFQERIKGKMIAALKQSGRYWLPSVHYHSSLKELLTVVHGDAYYGDMIDEKIVPVSPDPKRAYWFISGAEAGWSQKEREIFQKKGISAIRIVGTTLRAETAPLVFSSWLQVNMFIAGHSDDSQRDGNSKSSI